MIVFPFISNVPVLRVNALLVAVPNARLSYNWNVPPDQRNVIGKSIVFPFVLKTFVPEVAEKVVTLAQAVRVIPDAIVKLPYKVLVPFVKVHVKPVKSRLNTFTVIATLSLPAVIEKDGAFASLIDPAAIVRVPVEPE